MRKVIDYSIYKHRYLIGYTVLALAVVGVLVVAGLYIPGALRPAEITSAVSSTALTFQSFDPSHIINLPYHLLQRGSFELLGFSTISIKLVSVVFGIIAAFGIFLLIKEWFRTSIALTATLIAFTCSLFLFIAQDGTPQIYTVAVSAWLLYAATVASRRPTLFWKTLVLALMALNIYTPLGIYLNLAIVTTVVFHPHTRHIIKRMNSLKLTLAAFGSIVLAVPLLYGLSVAPTQIFTLLGIPTAAPDIVRNLQVIGEQLIGLPNSVQSSLPSPLISYGFLALVLIGVFQHFRVIYTARSYVMIAWALVLIPITIISLEYLPNLYILLTLWAALGLSLLITTWYRLFPRNPYARIAGLLPIVIVVAGISLGGISQYVYSYTYSPNIRSLYRDDLDLLSKHLPSMPDDAPVPVVVADDERNLYELYSRYNESIILTDETPGTVSQPTVITHSAALGDRPANDQLSQIITDNTSTDADRFYIYTPTEK